MRIVSVESTDLFVGTAQRPLQVVRVTLVNEEPGAASACVRPAGLSTVTVTWRVLPGW